MLPGNLYGAEVTEQGVKMYQRRRPGNFPCSPGNFRAAPSLGSGPRLRRIEVIDGVDQREGARCGKRGGEHSH